MDEIINIFQSLANVEKSNLPIILNALNEHQSFSQKTSTQLEPIVSRITKLLCNHSTIAEGLLILKEFIRQAPLDVIEQKSINWITVCTKICLQRKPLTCCSDAYYILGTLLEKAINIPELHKTITNTLLIKILETINVNLPIAVHLSALQCLEIAMKLYSGACSQLKNQIEKFLYTFIDNNDQHFIVKSGKCLHLFQQIRGGGGGAGGIAHKNTWKQYHLDIIINLHKLLNEIYSKTTELFDHNENDGAGQEENINVVFKITELELSDEPIVRATQLYQRFKILCEYLTIALIEPFPVAKQILPERILTLISRGLAINCKILSKNVIIDNIAIGTLIPLIHVSLLRLLNGLILVLRGNLLPYLKTILNVIDVSLKWTSSGSAKGFKKPFISLRCEVYQTLSLWLNTTQYGSSIELISDNLIQYILEDITPYQGEVTLQMSSGSKHNLSKKAKHKLMKIQNQSSNLVKSNSKLNAYQSDTGNEQLCSSALNVLIQIIKYAGCFLKPSLHKLLQENIVSLSLSAVDYHATALIKNTLYLSLNCRQLLFQTLHILCVSPNRICPPPVQYANEIFSIAQVHDNSAVIRGQCCTYLISLEKLIHPQKDCLYYPIDDKLAKQEFEEIKLNRNRLKLPTTTMMMAKPNESENDKVANVDNLDKTECIILDNANDSNDSNDNNDDNVENDILIEPQQQLNPSHNKKINSSELNDLVAAASVDTNDIISNIISNSKNLNRNHYEICEDDAGIMDVDDLRINSSILNKTNRSPSASSSSSTHPIIYISDEEKSPTKRLNSQELITQKSSKRQCTDIINGDNQDDSSDDLTCIDKSPQPQQQQVEEEIVVPSDDDDNDIYKETGINKNKSITCFDLDDSDSGSNISNAFVSETILDKK